MSSAQSLVAAERGSPRSVAGWLLVGVLAAAFLMGGSSRADVASLAILRPLAFLCLAVGFVLIPRGEWKKARVPAAFLILSIVWVTLELIPLPPGIWTALPGRELAVNSYKALGMEPGWAPFTLDPLKGWNAFFSLSVPFAVLALMLASSRKAASELVLQVILAFGLLNIIVSALQAVTGNPMLYFYAQTSTGVPVGLFANRNHYGAFLACLIPLITTFYVQYLRNHKDANRTLALAIVAASLVTVLVTVGLTGSRAGMILTVIAIPMSLYLYMQGRRRSKATKGRNVLPALIILTVLIAVLVVWVLGDRNVAVERLLGTDLGQEQRIRSLPTMLEMLKLYFPLGSGAGSFVVTFRAAEPSDILTNVYLNRAHNDWLELVLEHGLVGGLFLVATVVSALLAGIQLLFGDRSRNPEMRAYGFAGLAVLILLATASITDYPVRLPSLTALLIIAALWLNWSIQPQDNPETHVN